MVFEDDTAELISKGDYAAVKRRTTASYAPLASRMNSANLVKEAAGNLLKPLETRARKAEDYKAFSEAVDKIAALAETVGFPLKKEAGLTAVKLCSERMDSDKLLGMTQNRFLPKEVGNQARMELQAVILETRFLARRDRAPAPKMHEVRPVSRS
jgi:hypothetical protein